MLLENIPQRKTFNLLCQINLNGKKNLVHTCRVFLVRYTTSINGKVNTFYPIKSKAFIVTTTLLLHWQRITVACVLITIGEMMSLSYSHKRKKEKLIVLDDLLHEEIEKDTHIIITALP